MEQNTGTYASKRNKTFYVSTLISISLVLLMIGSLGLIILHAKKLSDYVKENIVLSVIVTENAREVDIIQLQKTIDTNPYIKSTQYISKELAARNLEKDLGEEFVKFLGYNPLLSSIDVYMKAEFANNDNITRLEKELNKNPLVKEVFYQHSLVDLINENIRTIGLIILAFSTILLLIAIALINNTIRLAMFSQRFLIKSMQLVGATRNFIRKPFILTGILYGFMGSLIAIIVLMGLLYMAQREIPELVILQDYKDFAILFAGVVTSGILISLFSTYLAVSKYLNLKTGELY